MLLPFLLDCVSNALFSILTTIIEPSVCKTPSRLRAESIASSEAAKLGVERAPV